MSTNFGYLLLLATGAVHASTPAANEVDNQAPIETLTIEGRNTNLIGDAISSSDGLVGQQELQLRPILRTGEILESVPGMVVTQHSGTGKANQYFLRGFNLDHGTDFATYLDGMPVNMRTHGHGQGYTDLNFIIPEALSRLVYSKGSYNPEINDFNGAGSAQLHTANRFDRGLAELTLGQDNYLRAVLLNSVEVNSGELLFALERNSYDGPWQDIKEDLDKTNGLVKYSQDLTQGFYTITLMAYDNSWNSADQIPKRAVSQGIISELGSLDPTLGGQSSRYSINANWQYGQWQGNAYIIDYDLNLWSNFTYFADNNSQGDQFEQVDKRRIYGAQASYNSEHTWAGYLLEHEFGLDARYDDIDEVGLHLTKAKLRHGSVRTDKVSQYSIGAYWQNTWHWNDNWRSIVSVRFDHFDFEVTDLLGTNSNGVDLSQNSGSNSDSKVSLKSSLIYNLSENWEWYAAFGQGIHSNDARGTTIKVDPADGSAITPVDPIVRTLGYETGIKGFIADQLNTSLSLWSLELDSELLFVGDAGNTEATRPSSRQGLEVTAYYNLTPGWTVDFEYSYSDAEFDDYSADGNLIPGAIEHVLQAGLSVNLDNNVFGSLRARHFGDRPLIEDGSQYSGSSTVWNLRLGYRLDNWRLKADVLNLFDSDAHDIDYFYSSQLAGEASPVDDLHYHIIEPRTVRLSASYLF